MNLNGEWSGHTPRLDQIENIWSRYINEGEFEFTCEFTIEPGHEYLMAHVRKIIIGQKRYFQVEVTPARKYHLETSASTVFAHVEDYLRGMYHSGSSKDYYPAYKTALLFEGYIKGLKFHSKYENDPGKIEQQQPMQLSENQIKKIKPRKYKYVSKRPPAVVIMNEAEVKIMNKVVKDFLDFREKRDDEFNYNDALIYCTVEEFSKRKLLPAEPFEVSRTEYNALAVASDWMTSRWSEAGKDGQSLPQSEDHLFIGYDIAYINGIRFLMYGLKWHFLGLVLLNSSFTHRDIQYNNRGYVTNGNDPDYWEMRSIFKHWGYID